MGQNCMKFRSKDRRIGNPGQDCGPVDTGEYLAGACRGIDSTGPFSQRYPYPGHFIRFLCSGHGPGNARWVFLK